MPDTSQQIFEFRGVDNFYFAEVLQDDENGYSCGTPIHIPVQEIGKSVDSASEAHYYDNKAMIVVNGESADTITLTLAPPALDKLAKVDCVVLSGADHIGNLFNHCFHLQSILRPVSSTAQEH